MATVTAFQSRQILQLASPQAFQHSSSQQSKSRRAKPVSQRAWQQVIDPETKRPYYWDTDTNETSWEIPANTASEQSESRRDPPATDPGTPETADPMNWSKLLAALFTALRADPTGTNFGETARSYRSAGVFSEEFFRFLDLEIAAADDIAYREAVSKLQAQLSNPLLRQAAPFEF